MAAVISRTSRPSTALIFGLKSHAVPIVRALPSAVSFGALGVLSSPRSRPLQSGNPLLPSQFPMGNRRPRSGEADAGPSKAQKVEGSSTDYAPDPDEAVRMLDYINKSWSAYHAVDEGAKMLRAAGYEHLKERDAWKLKKGGRYYFTRNQSTIVAFAIGAKYKPGNGFYIVGAHTDSPCLKLKPISKYEKSDHTMINVETYGSGLWTTWFDRDLSVAGRVLVRQEDGQLVHKLVKIDRPLVRIPMLAIHLQREIVVDGFNPNTQSHITPVLATAIKEACNAPPHSDDDNKATNQRHGTTLLKILSDELGCSPADIVDLELNICDIQPGVIGGAHNEFVWVGRLDNLMNCYCSLKALVDTTSDEKLQNEEGIRAIALFDHEEVGSNSAQGAGGPVMLDAIKRVATDLGNGDEGVVIRALQRSFLVSADMAHSLHPNYSDKHDPHHQPKFHEGIVIKHNSNQRYATNAVSAALFREIGARRGIPVQEFAIRSDLMCGSTVGPILSSAMGVRTIDVGAPQMSMHSVREMMGVDDVSHTVNHFKAFFEDFSILDATIDVDGLPPAAIKVWHKFADHAVYSIREMNCL